MEHRSHEAIARWERRWLAISGAMSLMFVILIAYALATEGAAIVQGGGRGDPAQLTASALFARPGVRTMGPGEFQVSVVAQTFAFDPGDIVLPVGARTHFYLTSRDVIHGFGVENTYINIEVIPGEIATFDFTFDRPGVYRVSCNEYCGIGHQDMIGKIEVVGASEYARRLSGQQATGAQAAPAVTGESVFNSNCAACHQQTGQGIPGAFPPLAGHAPDLYAADRGYPIRVLLHGLSGPITVKGAAFNGQMPAWSQLGDEQIAAVLDYIMHAWGNDAALPSDYKAYGADEIASARGTSMTPDDVHQLRGTLGLP